MVGLGEKTIFKDQVSFGDTARSFIWKNVSAVFKFKPERVSLLQEKDVWQPKDILCQIALYTLH